MIWRGKKLSDLTRNEFLEAVQQNNRFAEAALQEGVPPAVIKGWHEKALALAAEGERRGYGKPDLTDG
jgi:hypothetical protein